MALAKKTATNEMVLLMAVCCVMYYAQFTPLDLPLSEWRTTIVDFYCDFLTHFVSSM